MLRAGIILIFLCLHFSSVTGQNNSPELLTRADSLYLENSRSLKNMLDSLEQSAASFTDSIAIVIRKRTYELNALLPQLSDGMNHDVDVQSLNDQISRWAGALDSDILEIELDDLASIIGNEHLLKSDELRDLSDQYHSTLNTRAIKSESMGQLLNEYGIPIDPTTISLDSSSLSELESKGISYSERLIDEKAGIDVDLDSFNKEKVISRTEDIIQEKVESSKIVSEVQEEMDLNLSNISEGIGGISAEKLLEEQQARQALKKQLTGAAQEFIRAHADEISGIQDQMTTVKQVYSRVQNSQDLTSAVKQNSLEESLTGDRLVFGGNFNLGTTDPIGIDIAPIFGYQINKLFTIGISGSYRLMFNREDLKLQGKEEQTYGYSVFISHLLYKNFFGYLEAENKVSRFFTDETKSKGQQAGLLFGLGRQFHVSMKACVQVMVLYNFLHENNGVYQSPTVIKTGMLFR